MKKGILVLAILLAGCTKTDPVNTVVDNHIGHINDVLDYSQNNFEQTTEIVLLQNELKSCQLALEDVRQTYKGQISTCNAETRYWRLAATGLFIALCVAIFAIIKRWFR